MDFLRRIFGISSRTQERLTESWEPQGSGRSGFKSEPTGPTAEPELSNTVPPSCVIENAAQPPLRPRRLNDFIGQHHIKNNLRVYIKASLKRGDPLDHVLLSGPSGFGKATLAHVIANELGAQLRFTSAPEIKKTSDLAALLTNLQEGDVLVIDEIHRLLPALEEKLYPAMEDFSLDLLIGLGPSARSIKVELPKFTLIGTTEQVGLMRQRFMKCFGISFRLRPYETEELQVLIEQMGDELGVVIGSGAANIIARRAHGSPKAAKSLLRRIRDYAEVEFDGRITKEVVSEALDHMIGTD